MKTERGFSLIEIIVVLGIISGIIAVMIPALSVRVESQMTKSLREMTTTIRAAYDAALFSGRIHRLVIDLKSNEYWVEASPIGFQGRPSVQKRKKDETDGDDRKFFLERLDKEVENRREIPNQPIDSKDYFTIRSIVVQQRKALNEVFWSEVNDAIFSKRAIETSILINEFQSEFLSKPITWASIKEIKNSEDAPYAYIYFFPSGRAQHTSMQFGVRSDNDTLADTGPKITLEINPLTGMSSLLEGFQQVEFKNAP